VYDNARGKGEGWPDGVVIELRLVSGLVRVLGLPGRGGPEGERRSFEWINSFDSCEGWDMVMSVECSWGGLRSFSCSWEG
jgi:hypothetical protein